MGSMKFLRSFGQGQANSRLGSIREILINIPKYIFFRAFLSKNSRQFMIPVNLQTSHGFRL